MIDELSLEVHRRPGPVETVEPVEPEIVEPEIAEPEVGEAEAAEPEIAEPEVGEAEAAETELVEPARDTDRPRLPTATAPPRTELRVPARSAPPSETDPFGTAALRRAVLDAWAASPARFREDANAEEALATGGYADRLLVELAANGVDAALEARLPGRVRFTLDIAGSVPELRIANVGAPLTAAGVSGLASLRASAKRATTVDPGGKRATVGHFGVGFTAVLTVTDAPTVVSRTGSVRFSALDTAAAVADLGVAALDAEVAARGGHVPVLRLPWPGSTGTDARTGAGTGTWPDAGAGLPDGFDTQVRLPLRDGRLPVVQALLDELGDELLWALPGLAVLEVERPGRPLRIISRLDLPGDRTVITDDGVPVGYRSVVRRGTVPADLLADRPVEERGRDGLAAHLGAPRPRRRNRVDTEFR